MQIAKVAADAMNKLGLRDPILHLTSPRYRRHRALAEEVIRSIDPEGLERVRKECNPPGETPHKYLDLPSHVPEMIELADRLGLLDAPPMRVRDFGSGTGMFLYVLRKAGHDVMGLDLDEVVVYNRMIELLQIPRVVHRIERYKPLPDIGTEIDLITAISIMFDCHGLDIDQPVWMPPEWEFFLDDCKSRLKPGGRIFINFNPATKCDFDFIPDEVADWLRALPGASLSSSKEFLTLTRPVE